MSDDLVKRLRLDVIHDLEWGVCPVEIVNMAADRIEELKGQDDE